MRMPPSIHDANKSPQKRVDPRRRRNSESSVMDDLKVPLADKERRGKESNRQDRKDRDGKKPTSRKFDVIDAFDESMKLFGSGGKCFLSRTALKSKCSALSLCLLTSLFLL